MIQWPSYGFYVSTEATEALKTEALKSKVKKRGNDVRCKSGVTFLLSVESCHSFAHNDHVIFESFEYLFRLSQA
jgi:hypothetical protein